LDINLGQADVKSDRPTHERTLIGTFTKQSDILSIISNIMV